MRLFARTEQGALSPQTLPCPHDARLLSLPPALGRPGGNEPHRHLRLALSPVVGEVCGAAARGAPSPGLDGTDLMST